MNEDFNEQVVDGEVGADEQIEAPAAPETPDYEAQLNEYKQQVEMLANRLRPYQEWENRYREHQLEQLVNRVFEGAAPQQGEAEAGQESGPQLNPQDRAVARQLLQAGARYMQEARTIHVERLAGNAINMAEEVLGPNATINELKDLAGQLVDLGDIRLMERWKQEIMRQRQGGVRQQRLTSGVDRVVQSGSGSVGSTNPEAVGQMIAEGRIGELTPAQKRSYAGWRRSQGLPVPNGWSS